MALASLERVLPRIIALRSIDNDYLGYIHEDDEEESKNYLSFTETEVVSPYARFAVDLASKDGLVHIRSLQNNKYWERTKNGSISENPDEQYWITATATKPEEDQSKESCTLFKPIAVDPATNTVRIMHVQSGCYLCLRKTSVGSFTRCVLASFDVYDTSSRDIFTTIDWDSVLILPKYVAFKGDNGKYLINSMVFMTFIANDIGDSDVACEVVNVEDGNIRVKSTSLNTFWRANPPNIAANSPDTSSDDKFTLFSPVKVDNQTIALLNLGANYFCECMNDTFYVTNLTSVTQEAKLTVEEPVLTRVIFDIRYDTDNIRIYDESILVVSQNKAKNDDPETSSTLSVNLAYDDVKTTCWSSMLSLTLGMKVSTEFGIPFIVDGEVEISTEVQTGFEWGVTTTKTQHLEVQYSVEVPPSSTKLVKLIATMGKCDVPYTYTQRDTLYNGQVVTTDVAGGIFTGSNYYNFYYEEEPMDE